MATVEPAGRGRWRESRPAMVSRPSTDPAAVARARARREAPRPPPAAPQTREEALMALLVWFTMGIALWHFTVFLPDRFWQGIVGAFLGSTIGAVVFGAISRDRQRQRARRHRSRHRADRDSGGRDRPRRGLGHRRSRRAGNRRVGRRSRSAVMFGVDRPRLRSRAGMNFIPARERRRGRSTPNVTANAPPPYSAVACSARTPMTQTTARPIARNQHGGGGHRCRQGLCR